MKADELRNYISTREAADLIGVSPNTVREWCAKRLVRHVRIGPWGTNIRVHREDIAGMAAYRPKKGEA